jgi:uncharacterized HAD superfamily protein
VRKANSYFGTNIEPKDVTEYEIHRVLGVSREDYLKFYDAYGEEIHLKAKARNRAKRILTLLAQEHNIYYVTARRKRMAK